MNTDKLTEESTDGTIIQFLLGSHSYNGIWYGQTVLGSRFWWRKDLRKYIEKLSLPKETDVVEWIRVEDRLPEGFWCDSAHEYFKRFSQPVNVYVDNDTVGAAAYNRETKKWFIGDLSEKRYQEFERTNVTHWQPFPAPPKP